MDKKFSWRQSATRCLASVMSGGAESQIIAALDRVSRMATPKVLEAKEAPVQGNQASCLIKPHCLTA